MLVQRIVGVGREPRPLGYSLRLAREYRLVAEKARRAQYHAVRGYSVPCFELYHVLRHEPRRLDLAELAVTVALSGRSRHIAQGFEGMLCAELLYKAEYRIQQNDEYYRHCVGDLAEEYRNDRRSEQYHNHNVLELPDENTHRSCIFLIPEDVAALCFQTLSRLFFG